MVRIWKNKSVMQYTSAPYLATLFNCGLWVLYAMPMVHPHSFLVMTINGAGLVIELLYLILFFLFSDKKHRLTLAFIVLGELVFWATIFTLDIRLVHTWKLRSTVIGTMAVVGGIMMYASPLAVMVSTLINQLQFLHI